MRYPFLSRLVGGSSGYLQFIFDAAWMFYLCVASCLIACGGGAGDSSNTQGGEAVGNTEGGTENYTLVNEFSAWGRFDSFNRTIDRQGSASLKSAHLSVLSEQAASFRDEALAVGNGGDYYIQWAWSYERPVSTFDLYSAKDAIRQRENDPEITKIIVPLKYLGVIDGFWSSIQLSHEGRYIAAAWAANNESLVQGQSLLGIIDTQAPTEPRGSNTHIKNPPGGAGEKVANIQWISDNSMVVRNQSGRKFIWYVESNTYDELPAMPRQWGSYTLTEEFYSPDGQRFGGLMTADGGKTFEVWTSKPDYSDMQQITLAGLPLSEFQWVGSSKYLMVHFQGLSAGQDGNTCTYAILNANVLRAISASQVGALRTPSYLPCTFTATR